MFERPRLHQYDPEAAGEGTGEQAVRLNDPPIHESEASFL
jgi:hypothetical protein